MAKLYNVSPCLFECISCPNVRAEQIKNQIAPLGFYISERRHPGKPFVWFGGIKTSIIDKMWHSVDNNILYVSVLTQNSFYCFRQVEGTSGWQKQFSVSLV